MHDLPLADPRRRHLRASLFLLLATVFWGLSFPLMKALGLAQQALTPGASTVFVAALTMTVRFGVAAVLVALWQRRSLRRLTRNEAWQGAGLGIFCGFGTLLQMDGLGYTSASTSAFLTQSYCILIPIILSIRSRRLPPPVILLGCALVVAGVAVLADVDWRAMTLGRGELETLIASLFFTGQILWLDRPRFAGNDAMRMTVVMFMLIAVIIAPLMLATAPNLAAIPTSYSDPAPLLFTAVLIVFPTITAFVLMNIWQPHVNPAEAGLIYCAEPVFASLFALFLPAWLSAFGGLGYENEVTTMSLLIGGGLITVANVLIQWRPVRAT